MSRDITAHQSEAKFREQCRDELIPDCPHCLYKLPPFGNWTTRGLTGTIKPSNGGG